MKPFFSIFMFLFLPALNLFGLDLNETARPQKQNIIAYLEKLERGIYQLQEQIEQHNYKRFKTAEKAEALQKALLAAQKTLSQEQQLIHLYLSKIASFHQYIYLAFIFKSPDVNTYISRNMVLKNILAYYTEKVEAYASLQNLYLKLQKEAGAEDKALKMIIAAHFVDLAKLKKERAKKIELLKIIFDNKLLYQDVQGIVQAEADKVDQILTRIRERVRQNYGFARSKGKLPYPVQGRIEKGFGPYRDPILNQAVSYKGVDFRAKANAKVMSVFRGRVVFTGWYRGFGNVVIVDHGAHYHSLYAHLAKIQVKPDQTLLMGDPIGLLGDTYSLKGDYLYFEIRHKGVPINPRPFLTNPPH